MTRPCTICTSEDQELIDRALVDGMSQRAVSDAFRAGRSAVRRHAHAHLEPRLIAAASRQGLLRDDDLLARMMDLIGECERALDDAKDVGDRRAVIAAIREVRETLKAASALMPGPEQDDVAVLIKALGRVLPRFPDAASALAMELSVLGDPASGEVVASVALRAIR